MQVTISSDLEAVIKQKVKSGLFDSPEQVIRAGLMLLNDDFSVASSDHRQFLLNKLDIAIEQSLCGESLPFDVDEFLNKAHASRTAGSAS